jgi:hypothetical protein
MAIDNDDSNDKTERDKALHTATCDLLDALDDFMRVQGFNWREKKSLFLASCTPETKTNLMEFASWFDSDEEEDET